MCFADLSVLGTGSGTHCPVGRENGATEALLCSSDISHCSRGVPEATWQPARVTLAVNTRMASVPGKCIGCLFI